VLVSLTVRGVLVSSGRQTGTRQRVSQSSRAGRPRHVMMSVGHTGTIILKAKLILVYILGTKITLLK